MLPVCQLRSRKKAAVFTMLSSGILMLYALCQRDDSGLKVSARGDPCILPLYKMTGRVLTVPLFISTERGNYPTGNNTLFTGYSARSSTVYLLGSYTPTRVRSILYHSHILYNNVKRKSNHRRRRSIRALSCPYRSGTGWERCMSIHPHRGGED